MPLFRLQRSRSRGLSLWWVMTFWLVGCSTVTTQCVGCKKTQPSTPQVVFRTDTGKTLTVSVELACTPHERSRGLMHREELKANHGMLFVFPTAGIQSFWMKNTYIPLDMIHINKQQVVGIVENAKPHTTESRKVDQKATYVLEVNAFFARRHGIKVGDTVKFVGIPPCGY